MLARRFRVKETIPWFDGARLDDIVDYLTYVFAPIVLLWTTDRLPGRRRSAGCVAALPLLASCYQFCRVDAKTADHFFLGFPSYWNVVAFYAIVLDVGRPACAIALVVLTVLVFVPVRYVYPSRTTLLRSLNLALAGMWLVTYAVLLAQYPDPNPVVVALSLGYLVYYVGLSLYLTVGGAGSRSRQAVEAPAARSATRSAVSSMPQDSRTKPGRDGVAAPLRPPVDRAVHAAEAGRRGPQPACARSSVAHGLLVGELGGDHAVGPQHLPGGQREGRVAGAPRPADAGAPPGEPASTSATAAAFAACRASRRSRVLIDRWPSHASNGPGRVAGVVAPALEPREQLVVGGADVARAAGRCARSAPWCRCPR